MTRADSRVFGYLGGGSLAENPDRDDRGLTNTDPADVLDGMMCRGHMTELQATSLLRETMDFKYDFDGPGSCD